MSCARPTVQLYVAGGVVRVCFVTSDGRVFPVCVTDDAVDARLRRHVPPLQVRQPGLTRTRPAVVRRNQELTTLKAAASSASVTFSVSLSTVALT